MSEANGEATEAATSEARKQEREAQRAALFGPRGRGEYPEKATVRFWDVVSWRVLIGVIDYIRAPASAYQDGPMLPTAYIIDVGDGTPHVAYQTDIIEGVSTEYWIFLDVSGNILKKQC